MKAKTFIEYWKSPITEVMSIHKAYYLLSRPFKPEDIAELFEGWVQQVDIEGNPICWFQNGDFDIDFYSAAKYHINDGNRQAVPIILDQFISDCTRSGIELIWKEEIVKQYFK